MEPVHATIELGHTNLEKARSFRDQGNQALSCENYREALKLFHQCILLSRAIEQNCSLAIHQNSIIDTPTILTNEDPEKQSSLANERAQQTTMSEDAKTEAHRMMTECYINLATCVLNGGQRSADDYIRVIQYCDNVLSYEPTNEQISKTTFLKGLAYMKAENYSEAIEILERLPEDERAQHLIEDCLKLKANKLRKRDEMIQANFAKHQLNNERNGFNRMNGSALNGSINQ